MKTVFNKKMYLKKASAFLFVSALASAITACGGGSSSGGYNATDTVDRAPYFGIGNAEKKTGLENGTRVDINIKKSAEIFIADDVGLKSYFIEINNVVVAKADNLSGLEARVSLNLLELKDQNSDATFALQGARVYDARVVATDSKNQSTIANFDINTKEFYEYIAMIGDATPAVWTNTAAVPLTAHPGIEGRFTWTGHLNEGEIKFALAPIPDDWCCIEWIMPEANQQSVTNPALKIFKSNTTDNKWKISNTDPGTGKEKISHAGEYTIVIDQKNQKVHFGTPVYELGMVGDGTVAGWNLNGAVRFERDATDPAIFTAITTLAASGGEQAVKFFGQASGENYEYSNGYWIFAPSAGADLPTDAPGAFTLKVGPNSQADDLKWKVSPAKAGTYLITLNFRDNTILFTKQN